MSKELAKIEPQAVQVAPGDLIQAIARAASDPSVDVEKMERLFAMHERLAAQQRQTAFAGAMARLQERLPQINKYGQGKNSKFAKLEDIDVIVRPLLAEEGFSLSFDEEANTEKTVTFVMRITHKDGHSESKRLTVPIDAAAKNREGNSVRPAIQDAGSTVSYARRYMLKMILNIIETNEDTDGAPATKITNEQALDLKLQVEQSGMNVDKFLVYMKVGMFSEILASEWEKGQTVIRAAIAEKKK